MKPWEAYAQQTKGKPWEHYAEQVFTQKASPEEGTYKMVTSKGEAKDVPFSRVLDAGKAGWQISPQDFQRFTKDYTHTQGLRAEFDAAVAPEDESTWAGRGLNVFKGTLAGLEAPVLHPIQTAKSVGTAVLASGVDPYGNYPAFGDLGPGPTGEKSRQLNKEAQERAQQDMAAQAEELKKHPVYGVANVVGPVVVTEGLAKVLPHLPGYETVQNLKAQAAERMRGALREKFGGGTAVTKERAGKFSAETDKAREIAKAKDESGEAKRGAADDVNKARQEAYNERLITHQDKIESRQAAHQERVKEWEKKRAEKLKEHQDAVQQTQRENAQALQEHLAEREAAARHNEGLRQSYAQRQRIEQEVQQDSAELENRINDAKKKAQDQDQQNWNDVRTKNQGVTTPIEPLQDVVEREAAKADPATSALFRSILKGTEPNLPDITLQTNAMQYFDKAGNLVDRQAMSPARFDQMVETGEITSKPVMETVKPDDPNYGQLYQNQFGQPPPLTGPATFERLQRWYSYITDKMYGGGRVEGGLWNALSNVRKAIDSAMQKITAQTGTTADLDAARDFHQERMEAFSDSPREEQTVATSYQKTVSPAYAKTQALERQAARLAKFDKDIPVIGKRLQDAHAALDKLPSEEQARTGQKPIPEPPTPKPVPEAPEIPPAPKEPEHPKPPKPPSKKPYPEPTKNRPALPPVEDWTPKRIEVMRKNIQKYGATGQWVTRLILGAGGEMAFNALLSSHPTTAHVGLFSSGLLIGQGMMRLFSHIMSRDSIIDWLATPSAEDLKIIEQLPPDQAARLRTGIQALRDQAAKTTPEPKGYRINPVINSFLTAHVPQKEQPKNLNDIRKEAEQRNPAATPPPGPQSYTHYFDPISGKILPVAS